MKRSYELAVQHLNGRRVRGKQNLDDMRGSDDMVKWLRLTGHSIEDLNDLNIIHVSGTNGKGSTCSFAMSFLLSHGQSSGQPRKIGLYTSPHMTSVRERIRIDGEPISEELFTRRFFEVWDKLPDGATPQLDIPRYLQLLALVSYHVFITENVDVAIYETHLGGEYDATNIVQRPIVTAVTSIGMDHINLLGPKIEDIAWHKAGIFKPGSLAFSTDQLPEVNKVLQERAAERSAVLQTVGIDSTLPTDMAALKPKIQRQNCSLALEISRAWLREKASSTLTSDDVARAIKNFSWPGRFQKITEGNIQWFLDGAHNQLSVQHAVKWYVEAILDGRSSDVPPTRVLIFSNFSERDGAAILRCVADCLQENAIQVQHVILTSYEERRDGSSRIDKNVKNRFKPEVQERYAETWRNFDPTAEISRDRTIEAALDRVRDIGRTTNGIQALITGSLHLVSGALCLLTDDGSVHYVP